MSNFENDGSGDVKIIIKGGDNKLVPGSNNVYAYCNHCKKDISVLYIKSEANGKEVAVAETLKTNWNPASENNFPENDYEKCKKDNDYESCRKLLDDKKKNDKIHDLWVSFLDACTLHGFHYCFAGNPPARRVVWTLLLLGAFALFFEKCTDSIISFFEYPFTTTTLIAYGNSLVFPAVSICNYNDARLSKMNGTLMDRVFVGEKIFGKNLSHLENKITGEVMSETLELAAHRLDEMILECRWNNTPNCNHRNFTTFKNANGDVCYTFNSGKNVTPLETVITGDKRGLQIVIDTQHYEYYYDVQNAGFKVILHDQEETPVKMQGLAVSPGFTTYMELRKKKVTNLPYPYKTMCGMPKLQYFDKYSKSKCFLDRLTLYVLKHCDCRAWFMPGNEEVCNFESSRKCMWPAWEYFQEANLDKCPVACESVEFSAHLSYARFPANTYADWLAKKRNLTGTTKENRQFLRDNLLEIRIYYESLTFSDVQQVPSYDLYSLLGDVGGQIGLFLGASLLTMVEYLDLCAMVLFTKYKYRKK